MSAKYAFAERAKYTEGLITKLPDDRLQRVARSRLTGRLFWQIAKDENCSVEFARRLWIRACGLMRILEQRPEQVTAETPIAALLTSVRLQNACHRAGINTVGDLANCSLRDLLCIKHCGKKTAVEAMEILASAGLQLRLSDSESEYLQRHPEWVNE